MERRRVTRPILTRSLMLPAALLLASVCAEGANTAPTITLTSPAASAIYASPATITVSASASDPDVGGSVSIVTFYAEGVVIGTAAVAPYSITWRNVASGPYSLWAIATDNLGAIKMSSRITISVTTPNFNPPPVVSLTAPDSGSTYVPPAKIVLTANATDANSSVIKVDFYAGTKLLGSDTRAPYSVTWNNVVAGIYSLTAVATDSGRATTRSSPVAVTVKVAEPPAPTPAPLPNPNVPPSVILTSPSTQNVYSAPATFTLNANAADTDGTVTRVDFYIGLKLIGSAAAAPFDLSLFGVPAGNFSLTAVATDNKGATTRSAAVAVTVKPATTPVGPSLAGYQFSRGWATLGLPLPQGAATGAVQIAGLVTQTDVKTTWPDGSIRFAIVSAWIDVPGVYSITSGAVTVGAFTPTWPAASVSFSTGGQTYTATLPAFRGADSWLSAGPLVRETRVLVTPTAGTPHPLLQVIFDVRSYSDGGHRVDVTVQNVQDIVGGAPVTYDVAVTLNGATVYSKKTVTHPYLTRWRKVFATGFTEAAVTPDFTTFYAAKAVPQFLSTVNDEIHSSTGAQFAPLGYGDMSAEMSAPGGRAEIAPYPNWVAQYLVHKRPEQRAYMLASADLSGSWAGHITEPDGTTLISLNTYPTYWLDGRSGTHTVPQNGLTGPEAPRVLHGGAYFPGGWSEPIETAHMPSLTYVPYLVTGDRYYLDQMKFWANFAMLATWDYGQRGGGKGILDGNQPRGIGWGLRNLTDVAAYVPDADPLQAYFRTRLQNNLNYFNQLATTYNGGKFEFLFLQNPFSTAPSDRTTSLWQNSYIGWALDHAGQQGYGPVSALRDRIVRVQNLFLNSEAAGYPRINGAPYYPSVGRVDASGKFVFFTTMKQIFDATWAADPRTIAFAGNYGPEARLMLQIGVRSGLAGAQSALDYVTPFIVDDLNIRSGWAIAGP